MRLPVDRIPLVAVASLLFALGLVEAIAVYAYHPVPRTQVMQFTYAALTAILIAIFSRPARTRAVGTAPAWTVPATLALCLVASALIAQFALEAYPASGDEYGYNYVADTLIRGRLWNHAYPAELEDVLKTNYIGGHGDQRLSLYAPGWPAILIPFKLIGLPQFATAVTGLVAGLFLLAALNRTRAPRPARIALFVLAVVSPFSLFNAASFFGHTLTGAALLAIIWLEARDADRPSPWNRAAIGLAFSVLLTTRYEVFAIAFILFAADGLGRRKLAFFSWALPAALAAAPLTLCLLAYNWRITGSPFTTTITWVLPQLGYGLHATGVDGPHSAGRAVSHTVFWLGKWQDFAPVLFLPLYAAALWHRVRDLTLRWFDVLFPAVVVFFFFFPDDGGFQYGPRYWFVGFVAMPVTIAAGLPMAGDAWRIWRVRLDPARLATLQCAAFAGFTLGYSLFLYWQTESRLTPPRLAAIAPPNSVLLIKSIGRRFKPWQSYSYQQFPGDYTRNGLDDLGPVVVGVDLGDERTALLCRQMPDRAIYRMQLDREGPGGSLEPVCNLPPSAAPLTLTFERNRP